MDFSVARTEYGTPGCPTILFLHGIRLGRPIWQPHARALLERYHVVTLDLPGHGALSGVAFTAENLDALLDETLALLTASPLIVGYSLGGFVAMRYSADHPHRSAGLLLCGCTLDFEAWKWWPYGAGVSLSQLVPDSVFNALAHNSLYATLPKEIADTIDGIPFDRDVLVRTSDIARNAPPLSDAISTYRRPVLFVNGEYDFAFRVDERIFLHRLPQARLKIMPGLDHGAPMRDAEGFTAIVDEFARHVFAHR